MWSPGHRLCADIINEDEMYIRFGFLRYHPVTCYDPCVLQSDFHFSYKQAFKVILSSSSPECNRLAGWSRREIADEDNALWCVLLLLLFKKKDKERTTKTSMWTSTLLNHLILKHAYLWFGKQTSGMEENTAEYLNKIDLKIILLEGTDWKEENKNWPFFPIQNSWYTCASLTSSLESHSRMAENYQQWDWLQYLIHSYIKCFYVIIAKECMSFKEACHSKHQDWTYAT